MSQEHSIDKYVLNITASPGTNREVLYRNIEQSKGKIMEMLDEVFTSYFPATADIEISRIQLDLGVFTGEDFSETMSSRIRQLLVKEVEKLLITEEFDQYITETTKSIPSQDPFFLLGKFLENGFNAALQSQQDFQLDQYILQLLEKDSEKLGKLFRAKIHQSKVRKRIQQLKIETRQRLRATLPELFSSIAQEEQTELPSRKLPDFIIAYLDQAQPSDPTASMIIEVELRNRWQDNMLKPSIAYQLSVQQLENFTQLLWQRHSTFRWWISIREKAAGLAAKWNYEQQIRHLYFLYFGFLREYPTQTWRQENFEALLAEGFQQVIEKEKPSIAEETIRENVQDIFPFSQKKNNTKIDQLFASGKTRSSTIDKSELASLLQYGSPEELQLYVDYYLENEEIFRKWFFEKETRYELLARIWEHLSLDQLERMFPVLLKEEYSSFNLLLNELKLFFKIHLSETAAEQIYRQSLLLALETMHHSGPVVFYEMLTKAIVTGIWEELFLETFINPTHFPALSALLKNTGKAEKNYEEEISISFGAFDQLVQKQFPTIYTFVSIYLSVLKYYQVDKKEATFLASGFYKLLYQYLLQNYRSFSEPAFVHFVIEELAVEFSKEKELIAFELLQIMEAIPAIAHATLITYLVEIVNKENQTSAQRPQVHLSELSSQQEQFLQETLSQEIFSVQADSLRTTLTYYIQQEKFPEETKDGLLSGQQFRQVAAVFIRKYKKDFLLLASSVSKEEKYWQFLLTGSGRETGVFLLKQLSGTQFEEIRQWQKETIDFLALAYPSEKASAIELLAGQAYWNLLFVNAQNYQGLFSYLEQVLELINRKTIVLQTPDFTEAIVSYQVERKGTPLFVGALRKLFFVSGKNSSVFYENQKKAVAFSDLPFLAFIKQSPSAEAIRLYFEYHLSKTEKFREEFTGNSIPVSVLETIASTLTATQTDELLKLLFEDNYSYIKAWLKELILFLNVYHLAGESERILKRATAELLFFAIEHKTVMQAGILTGEALKSLFLQERLLEYVLNKEMYWNAATMKANYPKLSLSLESPSFINSYKTTISPEVIAELIRKQYPGQAGFIELYVSAIKVLPFFSFDDRNYLTELYTILYSYLLKEGHRFSAFSFVSNITAIISVRYTLSVPELKQSILEVVNKKIEQGDSRFELLKELLISTDSDFSSFEVFSKEALQQTQDIILNHSTVDIVSYDNDEFRQRIAAYPRFADFVFSFVEVVENGSFYFLQTKERLLPFYTGIEKYLEINKNYFYSQDFIQNSISVLSQLYSQDHKIIGETLLKIIHQHLTGNETRFEPIREILLSLGYEINSVGQLEKDKLQGKNSIALALENIPQELDAIIRLLEQKFPSQIGFVILYKTAIEQSTLSVLSTVEQQRSFYTFVYYFLHENKDIFSAALFIEKINSWMEEKYSIKKDIINAQIREAAAKQILKGYSNYEIISDLLEEENYRYQEVKTALSPDLLEEASLADSEKFVSNTIEGIPDFTKREETNNLGEEQLLSSFTSINQTRLTQNYAIPDFSQERLFHLSAEERKTISREILQSSAVNNNPIERYAEETRRAIEKQFPALFGFVSIYVSALEKVRLFSFTTPEVQAELYLLIYAYLAKKETNFSSILFVKEMTAQLASVYSIEQKQLGQYLLKVTEHEIEHGKSSFEVLKEILLAQEYEAEIATPVYIATMTEEERQTAKNDISKLNKKLKFELFRKAIGYYILQGSIPELAEMQTGAVTFQKYIKEFFYEYKGELLPLLKEFITGEQALLRIAAHKDEVLRTFVLTELSGNRYEEFILWNRELESFLLYAYPSADPLQLRVTLYYSLFGLLLQKDSTTVGLFSYLEHVFRQLKENQNTEPGIDFANTVEKYKQEGRGLPLLLKALERQEMLFAQNERHTILEKIVKGKRQEEEQQPLLEGRIPIKNAGIVLAGPFLYRYFDRLGMLENQSFKTPELACRGAQLLHFMATGNTDIQEQDLLLNKILCGVPLDTVPDAGFEITEEEKEISESLLQGILSNWDKLKTNSIDSLREGFLMREGWLEQTELGWTLEVERKAMDILVDLIPWSFNLVKLGWMETSLTTKWKKSLGE